MRNKITNKLQLTSRFLYGVSAVAIATFFLYSYGFVGREAAWAGGYLTTIVIVLLMLIVANMVVLIMYRSYWWVRLASILALAVTTIYASTTLAFLDFTFIW